MNLNCLIASGRILWWSAHCLVRASIIFLTDTVMAHGTSGSRYGGAFILNNLLKYMVENRFRVVRVLDHLTYSQNVSALFNVIFYIII